MTSRRREDQVAPLCGHEQLFAICETAERSRERGLPETLLMSYEPDPTAGRAYERIQRGVAALVRLLAGAGSLAIEDAMLALQAIDTAMLDELERAYGAADDLQARRNLIVALGLLRRQGVPRAGACLLRIGRREADEVLREAVLVQLNDDLAERFWERQLQAPQPPGEAPDG